MLIWKNMNIKTYFLIKKQEKKVRKTMIVYTRKKSWKMCTSGMYRVSIKTRIYCNSQWLEILGRQVSLLKITFLANGKKSK